MAERGAREGAGALGEEQDAHEGARRGKKKTNIARGVGAGRSALTRYVLHLAQPQDVPHNEGLGLKQEKEKDASRSELHARSK